MESKNSSETPDNLGVAIESPLAALQRFFVGDTVWIVTSGTSQSYVECPDCLGQRALTVTLGDGSQVSIDCDCCKQGLMGSRGRVPVYEWHCDIESVAVKTIDISDGRARYNYQDSVFATKEEAEAESNKVLAAHKKEEAHRFNHVKDNETRHRSWAFSVSYHRNRAKEARKQMEYHESKLVVAKAKAATAKPDTAAQAG